MGAMSDGMMFLPKSCWLSTLAASSSSALHQHVGLEDVDAHRGQRQVRRARDARRHGRLFLELAHAVVLVDAHDAEPPPVGHRHFERRQRGVGVLLDVEAQHLRVIHLVDVIARQHHDVARRLAHDGIQVLEDGVRGARDTSARRRASGAAASR